MSKTATTTQEAITIAPIRIDAVAEIKSSNLDEVLKSLRDQASKIKTDLKTDEDFGQATIDAGRLKEAETGLSKAKDAILEQAEGFQKLLGSLDEAKEEFRQRRLTLERQIKEKKAEVRAEIVESGVSSVNLPSKLASRLFRSSFEDAISGKSKLDSMRTAVAELADDLNDRIDENRITIAGFCETYGSELVPDADELSAKDPELVEIELKRRGEAKIAAEAQRKAKEEAEASKAKAELEAKLAKVAEEHGKTSLINSATTNPDPKEEPKAEPEPSSKAVSIQPRQAGKTYALTKEQEWNQYRETVFSKFVELKEARAALTNPGNIEAAQDFADGCSTAWTEANKKAKA